VGGGPPSFITAEQLPRLRQYLGNRYKNFDNILWVNGNDFTQWANPDVDAVVLAVAQGIQDNDPRHIHTVELNYPASGSLDDSSWRRSSR